MRAFLFPPAGQENNKLIKHGKKIFLASKPAPASESKFMNRQSYQLGSMSHYLNSSVSGYHDLPDFPEIAPDPEVRNVEPPRAPNPWEKTVEANKAKKRLPLRPRQRIKIKPKVSIRKNPKTSQVMKTPIPVPVLLRHHPLVLEQSRMRRILLTKWSRKTAIPCYWCLVLKNHR